jgi:hypothetical protein
MTIYICNAFALSMLDRASQESSGTRRAPTPISEEGARTILRGATNAVSAVGHADTAAIFSKLLDRPVEVNRVSVKLGPDDLALIGQYIGPRLPEGATKLPDGATIEWWVV